jgi:hypothetical protein
MTTLQKIEKLEKEVTNLKSLFYAIIPLDKEGAYKDTFVQNMRRLAQEKSVGIFAKKGDLLKLIK